MKKLLKEFKLNSDMQYFQMIADSFIEGQIAQAKEFFKAMPRDHKKAMIKIIVSGSWSSGINDQQQEMLWDIL